MSFRSGADAANYFAGPESFAEYHERAILKIANRAKEIIWERGVIGVGSAMGEFTFESAIAGGELISRPRAECLGLKAIDQRFKRRRRGCGDHDAAVACFAVGNLMPLAIVANTIEMAEKIEPPGFGSCRRGARGETSRHARSAAWVYCGAAHAARHLDTQ